MGLPELRQVAALPLRYLAQRRAREGAGRACAENAAGDRPGVRRRQALVFESPGADPGRRRAQRGRARRLCADDDRGPSRGALPGAALRTSGLDRAGAAGARAPGVESAARSASGDGRDHGRAAGRDGGARRQGARSGARGGGRFGGRFRGGVEAVEPHHIVHWANGGETSLDNMILLCSAHHAAVHEGGFRIERDYRDRWFFRRPHARAVPACGYRPEVVTDDGCAAAEEYFAGDSSAEVPLAKCSSAEVSSSQLSSAEGFSAAESSAEVSTPYPQAARRIPSTRLPPARSADSCCPTPA